MKENNNIDGIPFHNINICNANVNDLLRYVDLLSLQGLHHIVDSLKMKTTISLLNHQNGVIKRLEQEISIYKKQRIRYEGG